MPNFWWTFIHCINKIRWFPTGKLIFGPKTCFHEPLSKKSYNRTDIPVVKEAAIYISYSFKQELSLFSIKGSGRMRTLNRMESNYDLMYRFYIQNEDKLYEKTTYVLNLEALHMCPIDYYILIWALFLSDLKSL